MKLKSKCVFWHAGCNSQEMGAISTYIITFEAVDSLHASQRMVVRYARIDTSEDTHKSILTQNNIRSSRNEQREIAIFISSPSFAKVERYCVLHHYVVTNK